jgi:Zn-dependent protease
MKYIPLIKMIVFILSFTAHELGHGYAALLCGDTTARDQGRLTFWVHKHMDLFGSVIIPLMLYLMNSATIIGWGKTVPVDFTKYTRPQHLLVASAGVLVNLALALFGLGFFYLTHHLMSQTAPMWKQIFCITGFMFLPLNLVLCLFNLLPLCPFDGWVFLKGFSAERTSIQKRKVKPLTLWINILLAFVILKLSTPWLIVGLERLTIGG